MNCRRVVLFLLLIPTVAWGVCSGSSPTWTAASASYADVSACVTAATAGDTINVPAGSATWASTVDLGSKYLSIIGAGQGVTNITNSVGSGNLATLFRVSGTGANFVRISGFTFINADFQSQIINMIGPISAIRIDHITFNKGDSAFGTNWIDTPGTGPVYGVADHCIFLNMARAYYPTDRRTTDSGAWGQVAWTDWGTNSATYPGSNKMFYIEDSQFTWDLSNTYANAQGALYGGYGGKAAYRHNTFTGWCTYVDAHGDGSDYGTLYYEIYNNTFSETEGAAPAQCPGQGEIFNLRGGQHIVHDNTFTGSSIPTHLLAYWYATIDAQCLGGTPTVTGSDGKYCELVAHRIANTYYWNNTWNGSSTQSSQVAVADSGQTSAGYSASRIALNTQFFEAAPSLSQTYYPYTPYTYPHPLIAGGTAPTCTLTASPLVIKSGSTSTLTFTPANTPTDCSIDQAVGSASCAGATPSVSPTTLTTYTATVTNASGSNTCTATVTIGGCKLNPNVGLSSGVGCQ